MADNKTQVIGQSVDEYLASIEPPGRRAEAEQLHALFQEKTGMGGEMWTGGIVGYGQHEYVYASGRRGVWLQIGFSARKSTLTIYFMSGVKRYEHELAQVGAHTVGASCLYIKKLEKINVPVLGEMIEKSYADVGRDDIDYGK